MVAAEAVLAAETAARARERESERARETAAQREAEIRAAAEREREAVRGWNTARVLVSTPKDRIHRLISGVRVSEVLREY